MNSDHSNSHSLIWISVGELSGDRLGAWFLKSFPTTSTLRWRWIGIAGPHLRDLGVESLLPMEKLQGIGIGELKEIPWSELVRLMGSFLRTMMIRSPWIKWLGEEVFFLFPKGGYSLPKAAVFVDYGGFHLLLGVLFARLRIPIAYLAPPKLWAWGRFRAYILKRFSPILGVLFPFEVEFYKKLGLKEVIFVGHPVAELLHLKVDERNQRFYLLPGSRPQEWKAHLPLLLEFIPEIRSYGLVPTLGVPLHLKDLVLSEIPPSVEWKLITHPEDYHDGALAIAASGTVNLELAALGIPHLVIYKPHPLTLCIGKRLVYLPWINPVNLVAGREVIPEFLGNEAKKAKMLPYLEKLWQNRSTLSQTLRGIVEQLYAPEGLKEFQERILSLMKDASNL